MDSYDIFGEDGSGMLEGLADLAGTDNFTDGAAPAVSAAPPREPERSYRQVYSAAPQQEGSLQKLASFGGGAGSAASGGDYTEYGGYPPPPRPRHPPLPTHHPPHHPHPYTAYHAAPDPSLYSMTEHPGVWPGAPGPARGYPPQGYRHPYDQQKIHQYPTQQGSSLSMQAMGQGYMQRQPHYAQPPTQQMYSQQQSYPGYNQIHPQNVSRMGQHATYHQQLEMTPHQYGHVHGQQAHPSVPPHQTHQAMGGHQAALGPQPGMQPHMHHPAPGSHHHPSPARQAPAGPAPPVPAAQPPPTVYPQPPHQAPHLTMPMGYQPHQMQRTLDVNVGVANQYKPPGIEGASPQYRTPFPQLSPQMSPRAQISPRPQAPQMSPRQAMSPAKTTSASPHGPRTLAPSPAPLQPTGNFAQQSTLQALEQMVMPGGGDYSFQRNPTSPALNSRLPASPQPWGQSGRISAINGAMETSSIPSDIINHNQKANDNANLTNVSSETSILNTHSNISQDSEVGNITGASEQNLITKDKEIYENIQINPTESSTGSEVLKMAEDIGSEPENPAIASKSDISSENESRQEIKDTNVTDMKLKEAADEISELKEQNSTSGSSHSTDNSDNLYSNLHDKLDNQGSTMETTDNGNGAVTVPAMPESLPRQSSGLVPTSNLSMSNQLNILQPTLNPVVQQIPYEQDIHAANTNRNIPINIQTIVPNNMSPSIPSTVPPNNLSMNMPTNVQPNLPQNFLLNVPSAQNAMAPSQQNVMVSSGLPTSLGNNIQAQNMQNVAQQSSNQINTQTAIIPSNSNLTGMPPSMSNLPNIPQNMSQGIPPNLQALPSSMQPGMPPNMPPGMTPNLQPGLPPNMQPGLPPNMQPVLPPNMQSGLPPTMQPVLPPNIQPGIPPNMQQGMPPMQHSIMMAPGMMPHPSMNLYQGQISHHQERAALQQQLQEIFCMPKSPENQEASRHIQERLAILQQHEVADKCNGGPTCLLQNPIYGSTMVESPQVSSTTGRGRSKGPPKPRKPRVKKEKPNLSQSVDQLPVSEDCVTAGTGLQVNTSAVDFDFNGEITNMESNIMGELTKDGKPKKPKTPRKPREKKPKVPKEPKPPKVPKEKVPRKKREPKDPNAPKRKRTLKKDVSEIQADTTTTDLNTTIEGEQTNVGANLSLQQLQPDLSVHADSDSGSKSAAHKAIDETVTDFDDIPVSKIAIKDLLEEAEAKREREEKEDSDSSVNSPTKKKLSGKKKLSASRKASARKSLGGKKKKRGGIVPESDGEPDDLATTPPPSPPAEGDCDSSKRRSARHTQRKKYTDDVLLRLSDDEFSIMTTPRRDNRESKVREPKVNSRQDLDTDEKGDNIQKPNYMYINTTEEDSMIVQHVLACRMGKREIKPEPLPEIKKEINVTDENTELVDDEIKSEDTKEDQLQSQNVVTEMKAIEATEESCTTEDEQNNQPIVSNELDKKEECDMENNDVVEISPPSDKICHDTLHVEQESKPIIVDVEEFYVKYRNFSYLHCEWKTEEELYKGDKRIFSKIKRFKQKQAQQLNIFELFDDEPFNPDYVEVERVLDVSEHSDPGADNAVKHYLVKWKGLQYEESTWELEEDVDCDKIKQFEMFNSVPPKEKWKYKRRPSPDQWTQLNESPAYKGANTLRPYQLEGLNWLLFSWYNNRNCILADEMGLGKTIQSLTFVNSVWEYGIRGPFLIIAPLSTIPNWQREFEGWTDMNVIVYHGSQQSKSMIHEYEFYYKNENNAYIKEFTKFNVLITTFEIIVTDFQELKLFNWRLCVIDEAHRLKNRNCKLLEGLRQLNLEHRVLLSGTPLQNNVNELFSLLNFLEPSQFSSNEAFLTEFGQLKTESEVLKLQALLKPMMLRRLKEDVEKSLAPKEETIVEVELTNIQKKYYRGILERNFSFLTKGTVSAANIPNLMNTMMELRKCCIHPYLLNGAEEQIQFDYKQTHGEDADAYYKALIQSSGKMVLVDKLLPKLKAGGHRVLIFSQMVRCLDILEDYLMFRRYPYERIDGRIRGNLRQEAIDRFSKPDSDRFVFLLCTKAGGLGINLTAADTVIIYDSDWNPQNDLQAQARCHRIGQQKMVKIYRLICQNSYEREMFDKASLKLGLDKAILQSMNTSQGEKTGTKQLSKKEIEDLLKKGAYGAVMDEDNAGDKFCEEDIEMILARRTQVIQMESEKGSTFSKASFSANNQRCDIDIRDPDFWNKWAKKAEIDTVEKKEDEDLIVTEPRRRTIIKRYGHDDGNVEMSDMEVTPDTDEEGEGIGLRSKKKKDRFGKKGRKYNSDDYIPRHEGVPIDEEVVYGNWARSECFKIERGLLTYGWARWDEIVGNNQFRKGWTLSVIEDCARIIVLYCLRHYKGDEKIRNFIWDLIEPCENGEVTISRNHSGLHNPVPRGRNAKKKVKKDIPKQTSPQKWEDPNHWSSAEKYDCEAYLESSYKKHLFRHANKVLLRVRMMYYIKHEVIGDFAQRLEAGVHASALGMRVPRAVESAPPRVWWDSQCDVSLLVGTYLHGYENYLAMRSDPQLCYVDKLGPPDDVECTNIKNEESGVGVDEDATDEVSSGAGAATDASPAPSPSPRPDDDSTQGSSGLQHLHQWPSMQDLNTRLRRLITSYQRNYKKEELKMQQRAKKLERRERMEQLAREEAAQWRWVRADEEAFRRTVASYGVEFDPATKSLRWGRFRALARLDSKSDDALTDYLKAFMAMCKRQCGLVVGEAELPTRADLRAEPIGEERAIATLERIDLLRVLREEVAPHAALDARLALCEPAPDTPPWWTPARHDKLLVLGVCKHGLGDTYHKLFCDPKLPFADCARKYTETRKLRPRKETRKPSTDDEDDIDNNSDNQDDRPALRRSKRNSNTSDREKDDDRDALSELESLARLGRAEPSPPASHWFSERALETRLHHIAHAVQNGEWPPSARARAPEPAHRPADADEHKKRKQHIAIDVETERAKLHALLTSPQAPSAPRERLGSPAAHAGGAGKSGWERDDASSDSSSRRSTPALGVPAPPPAHQRVAPSPAPAAPADACAPLDLSEAQDFTLGRRTPALEPPPAHTPILTTPQASTKGKLDNTLSKLLKRKNVPEPEVIIGKEKKRRKLDEIVLGLSAAKGQGPSTSSAMIETPRSKNPPILPNVTVTPAAPPRSSPAPPPTQKPFSVTVTSVPAPHAQPKELSSFLQQSLEQAGLLKTGKMNLSSSSSSSTPPKAYSHEAKVHKWLAEQAGLEERRRRAFATPRISAEEHVPVVHRSSGKRLVGHKAPQLKHLHQWIAENPMYEIDPKWTESMKEYKSPQDVRSQRPSPLPSTSTGERKKGRPPSLDTGSGSSSMASGSAYASLSQNLAGLNPSLLAGLSGLGSFDSKTLSATLSNLTGFDAKTLSSFDPKLLASLTNFDPKNNPLLMPFNSMPNMLSNMAGGNVFANLAGLSLPGFSGVDMASLGIPTSGADSSNSNKGKGRKSSESAGSSASKSSATLASSTASQFPFVFPNPNLLYPQLGLSGLNPFGMQSGLSAYDALAQCGLLNGSIPGSSSGTTAHSTAHSTSRNSSKVTPSRSTPVTSATTTASSRHQKSLDRQQQAQLQQLLLPPETYILESLSKHVSSYEAAFKADKRSRESERRDVAADLSKTDKRKPVDSYRNYPPEFAAVQERLLKSSKGDKKDVDISKMLFEQMASGALSASLVSSAQNKRPKESEIKEYDKLNKTPADFMPRSMTSEDSNITPSAQKRVHEESSEPENLVIHSNEQNPPKKLRESEDVHSDPILHHATPHQSSRTDHHEQSSHTGEMDLEELIAPSTVIKSGPKPRNEIEQSNAPHTSIPISANRPSHPLPIQSEPQALVSEPISLSTNENISMIQFEGDGHSNSSDRDEKIEDNLEGKESGNENTASTGEEASDSGEGIRKGKKRGRRSTDESGGNGGGVKRELRSSAGRQAAAAAARHAAANM